MIVFRFACAFALSVAAVLLGGCASLAHAATGSVKATTWTTGAEAGQFVTALAAEPGAPVLVSGDTGLAYHSPDGRLLDEIPGRFGVLDHRVHGNSVWVAAVDKTRRQVLVTTFSPATAGRSTEPVYLDAGELVAEGLCLYRMDGLLYLFILGEEGVAEQWLVGRVDADAASPRLVRQFGVPAGSEFCAVDDARASLFVVEPDIGIWRYDAGADSEATRDVVALTQPHGPLAGALAGTVSVREGLWVVDGDAQALRLLTPSTDGAWSVKHDVLLKGVAEPEMVSSYWGGDAWQFLVATDGALVTLQVPASVSDIRARLAPEPPLPLVMAALETQPVRALGDAADDPAIWVNRDDPASSRVLATDKKWGLLVFDLEGQVVQSLGVGRLNNVDLRDGFALGGRHVGLAVATHRDLPGLTAFSIDADGRVAVLGQVQMPTDDAYGVCMFVDRDGVFYAFANDQTGRYLQYELTAPGGQWRARLVREFRLPSQPEGCVAHDEREVLFVGEERAGVFAVDARAQSEPVLTEVARVSEELHADVEGLALYYGKNREYLVISSQGNDSFVVVDAQPPYASRGAFRIGVNVTGGVDAVSETDGLDVSSVALGPLWPQGLLVVQDGRNRMPVERQNFKYVAWHDIARLLELD